MSQGSRIGLANGSAQGLSWGWNQDAGQGWSFLRVDWVWRIPFKEADSQGWQVGAGLWQEASVIPHLDLSAWLLGVPTTWRLASPPPPQRVIQEQEAEATCPVSLGLQITYLHLCHILLEESHSL